MSVLSSSTKVRLDFWKEQQSLISEAENLPLILNLLFKTVAHYQDHVSRDVVVETWKKVLEAHPEVLAKVVPVMKKQFEAYKFSAISDQMVLLEWSGVFVAFALKNGGLNEFVLSDLINVQAQLLEICSSSTKLRLAKSALRQARAALSLCVGTEGAVAQIQTVCSKGKTHTALLGCLASAAAECAPHTFGLLDDSIYVSYYGREVLGAKQVPSEMAVAQFCDGYFRHLSADKKSSAATTLADPIKKSILRAPESVLAYAIPLLLQALGEAPEIVQIVADIAASLVACLKSSNEATRLASVSTIAVAQKFNADAVAKELAGAVGKATSTEHKTSFGQAIGAVVKTDALAAALVPVVAKEKNEVALAALAKAFLMHYTSTYKSTLAKGVTDSNAGVKRVWIQTLCEFSDYAADVAAELESVLKTTGGNVAAATVAKTAVSGLGAIYLLSKSGKDLSQSNEALELALSPRVYTKLQPGEFGIGQQAVAALFKGITEDNSASFGEAVLFYAFGTSDVTVDANAQRQAGPLLQQNYSDALARAVLSAIDRKLAEGTINPGKLLMGLFSPANDCSDALLFALVPLSHPSCPTDWTQMVLHAGKDPRELLVNSKEEVVKALSVASDAAYNAIATVCFIAPDVFTAEFVSLFEKLSDVDVDSVDSAAVAVYHTPVGEMAFDVVKKTEYVTHKNSKEYQDQLWEDSLRKELEKKKGKVAAKKYTKEEQLRVDEQLAKEAVIRDNVTAIHAKLQHALGVIAHLSTSAVKVDNGINEWFPRAMALLVRLMENPNMDSLLDGSVASTATDMAQNTCARLGTVRPFLAVCLLRMFKNSVKEELTKEPMDSLVTRLLYKIRSASEQEAFDSVSLVYLLPLVLFVLKNSSKLKDKDVAEEQLHLAVEIVTSHTAAFADPITPRADILASLIALMKSTPTKAKLAKECLYSVVESVAVSITHAEEDVLISNVFVADPAVRHGILEAIDAHLTLERSSPEIWVAVHDTDDTCSELAQSIWDENDLKRPSTESLLPFLDAQSSSLRLATSRAIADGFSDFSVTYQVLIDFLNEKSKPVPAELDQYGKPKKGQSERDQWEARCGGGGAMHELAPHFQPKETLDFISYLVGGALGDKNSDVRQEFNDAGLAVITAHGLASVEPLMKVIQDCLGQKDTGTQQQDWIRGSAVVLYGALARHLDSTDDRLPVIYDRMLLALDTPSEGVQHNVSECLSPLVAKMSKKARGEYIEQLTEKLLSDDSLAVRRGAAYGIAGIVRGGGILAIAEYDIIRSLQDAMEDKRSPSRRQGAQFAVETLSMALHRHFEPYVFELMPLVLAALGDMSIDVREATTDSTRQIMKNTTGYGVSRLIPMAIENLNLTAWRSKKGAVELLGNMAYLSPHELSQSLSQIVPEIVAALNDTHKEVRNAASSSLQRFGEVISNPEIQALVPKLINAIADPTKNTEAALDGLLKTQFVHYIDAPSLALIIHVLQRGLQDRSAAVKKKACQIVGNMAILTSAQDITPYLPELTSSLEQAMVDPVPGTRATAARALGSLVEKLGEVAFADLIPRLLSTMRDQDRAGDHLGAAQGLAEAICGLGLRKLEEILPTIIKSCSSSKPHIRAAFMPLMIFLPACFGNSLTPYLSQIIPPILGGLADENDSVRDASLKAGRLLVSNYASKAVDLLLPELERGISDSNHRIRLASVELLGDLLFQITGLSKKTELDETDDVNAGASLLEALGQDRRDRVLANLFVCRADTSGQVRLASIEVWKSLVANTPRTIKEILPTLTQIVVRRLASSDVEQREIAASTLGELVRRVGGNALEQLLPTLQANLGSSDADQKQGICIALRELIVSSTPEQLALHQITIVAVLRDTLVDLSPAVRSAAADAFDAYQEAIGNQAVNEILPHLLSLLPSRPDAALAALRDIMQARANTIFPIVLPTLLHAPITVFNAQALASLATAAGAPLLRRLPHISNALVAQLIETPDEAIQQAFIDILLAVGTEEGLHPLMQHLKSMAKHEDSAIRALLFQILGPFFRDTSLDLTSYAQDWVEICVYALDDAPVAEDAKSALQLLVSTLAKDEMERLARPAYNALKNTSIPLVGINVPKGPACILPIFVQGLMYGSSDQREASAQGMGCIVERVDSALLKVHITQITGPLIRTIGERFPAPVKVAIVNTLNLLLQNCSAFLKPFLPQLQRTFAKCLSDTSSEQLRNRAAEALGTLITLQTRVDPLVSELVTGVKNSTDQGVTNAMFKALNQVVLKAGSSMSQQSRDLVFSLVESVDGLDKTVLAAMLGGLARVGGEEVEQQVFEKYVSVGDSFAALILNALIKNRQDAEGDWALLDEATNSVVSLMASETPAVSDPATLACGKLLLACPLPFEASKLVLTQLAQNITVPASHSSDTRRLGLVVLRTVARHNHALVKPHLTMLAQSTFACVREMIIPIKLAAEKAWLALFQMVEESDLFEKWFAANSADLPHGGRSIGDYTKRVATRLANAERERIEEGGDDDVVFSDRREDEEEIWQ